MTNSPKSGWAHAAAALGNAAAAFAHTPFPYLLGMALIFLATRWDGHIFDQKGCFQLQEIQGRIFKVDTCTGKAEELPPAETAHALSPDKRPATSRTTNARSSEGEPNNALKGDAPKGARP